MGCDGGSIPRRDELVKLKKKQEKPNPNEVDRIKWTSCAISKEPLKEPIVACELGGLYNKEAVIKNLLEKTLDESLKYIRSLKDLIPVRFTPNPALSEKGKAADDTVSPFICPITMAQVGGHHRFSLNKSCGCVLSERALREVPSSTCLQCGKPFSASDIIPLNPTEEELVELRNGMQERRVVEKEKRREKSESKKEKSKKEKKEKGKNKSKTDAKLDSISSELKKIKAEKKRSLESSTTTTTTTTTTTSSSSTDEPPSKLPKKTDAYSSIFTSSIKPAAPGERVQETFMCRNVLRA